MGGAGVVMVRRAAGALIVHRGEARVTVIAAPRTQDMWTAATIIHPVIGGINTGLIPGQGTIIGRIPGGITTGHIIRRGLLQLIVPGHLANTGGGGVGVVVGISMRRIARHLFRFHGGG